MNFENATHLPLLAQQELVLETVRANTALMRLIRALPAHAWVGSGVLFQNVWNARAGLPWNTHVKDADILFFDPDDLSVQAEESVALSLADQDFEIDVVNVARVHLWYPEVFGKQIPPYDSIATSLSTWPTIASALAVRERRGELEMIAPFGFHDVLAGWIRPNRVLVDPPIYEAKATRWKACWPDLKVWPW